MLEHSYAGRTVRLDEQGFLAQATEWTPEIAEAIAAEVGLTLTAEHWKVIQACRDDAARNGGESPGLRRITQVTGVTTKDLYRLFPKGPGKLAARIAGLPKPKACL
jgi:tRNA 2-thiouridine synthesizing protein E